MTTKSKTENVTLDTKIQKFVDQYIVNVLNNKYAVRPYDSLYHSNGPSTLSNYISFAVNQIKEGLDNIVTDDDFDSLKEDLESFINGGKWNLESGVYTEIQEILSGIFPNLGNMHGDSYSDVVEMFIDMVIKGSSIEEMKQTTE